MSYSTQSWVDLPTQTTPVSASRLAHMETGIGNALDRTETGTQNVAGNVSLTADKHLILTATQNTGNIARLIELHSTYDVDRPWISWVDENNRHRVAMGYHTKLTAALGGDTLIQYEIKTIASASGPDPTDMRTRFTVGTDAQRVKIGFVYTDVVEVYQGENTFTTGEGVTTFGLSFRAVAQDTAAGGSNFVIGNLLYQIDATDNAFCYLDVTAPYSSGGSLFPGNKGAQFVFFRNTNLVSSSNPKISVKKGDGTNTDAVVITAKSGTIATIGPIGINGSAAPAKPTVTGAKGSNAALGSLLTALASYGFITDSTTA